MVAFLTAEDPMICEPIILKPTLGSYRVYVILYDPSHAGTTLVDIPNILEGYGLKAYSFVSFEHVHPCHGDHSPRLRDIFKYTGDAGFEKALEVKPGDPLAL